MNSPRIYVASSWRNSRQPAVVEELRRHGYTVYDFRHPTPGNEGFRWSEIDPEWRKWSPDQFKEGLGTRVAELGFGYDMEALATCDVCILVLPCGKSAHLELGYAVGADLATFILMEGDDEPELMYKMVDDICLSFDALLVRLAQFQAHWAQYQGSKG